MTDTEEYKTLKSSRSIIKGKVTRIFNYITGLDSTDKRNLDLDGIKLRCADLSTQMERFDEIQQAIELIEKDEKKADEERSIMETRYYSTRALINKLLEKGEEDAKTNNQVYKLPRLELPSYSGDIREWPAFRNLFECAMNGGNVPELQRLQYLKGCLRGEAASLINSLLIIDGNFGKAMSILESRYENQTIVVNYHLKNFMSFPILNRSNIKDFLNVLQQSLDSLSALNLPVQHWDVLLVYIITQKLDNSLRAAWELTRKETTIPTVAELLDFLKLRATAFELMNDRSDKFPQSQSTPKLAHISTSDNCYDTCTLCQGQHNIAKCVQFLEMPVDRRINYIKSKFLCYNCLQPYTAKHKCSKRSCLTCNGKHHTLIHLANLPPKRASIAIAAETTAQQQQHTNATLMQQHPLQQPSLQQQSLQQQTLQQHPLLQQSLQQSTPQQLLQVTQQQLPQQHLSQQELSQTTYAIKQPITTHTHIQGPSKHTLVTPTTMHVSNTGDNQILLSTAIINIQDDTGIWHSARVLLDSGSEVNIVAHRLVQRMNSKLHYDNHIIQGIGESGKQTQLCMKANIASRLSDFTANLEFIVMDNITVPLPHNFINTNTWNMPAKQHKLLADPTFYKPSEIDMLIGAQLFYSLLLGNQIRLGPNRPILIETVFGWVVSGNVNECASGTHMTHNAHVALHIVDTPSTDDLLVRFWQQEEVSPKTVFTPEQQYCEQLFIDTTVQDETGHFVVEMPIQNERVQELGNSFHKAYRCLLSLESRFQKDPLLYTQYKAFIYEFIELGHAEFVDDFQHSQEPHCFLPHLGILRPGSRSTKLRTVFNASSKTSSGLSLNDIMFDGPNIYNDVLDIILRFRMYKYAFTCDIVKMFRTILVKEEQRPLLRILWRDSKSSPLKCIQLRTVSYGTKCAPYLACRTLRMLAGQHKQLYSEAADIIESECYMDDFLSGADTLDQAQRVCGQLIDVLKKGNFKLHKWTTNEPKILTQAIPTNDDTSYDFTPSGTVKTLGVKWLPQSDMLTTAIPELEQMKLTKRNVLSAIAQIYDPIGILAPTVIIAKILMQSIWKAKIDWDSVIPEDLQRTWLEFQDNLPKLQDIEIPRYYFSDIPSWITLIGFSDASAKAFGASLYFRATYPNRAPTCSLVMAKTRVSPIKTQSLPRLELSGCLLLAQLVNKVNKAFKDKFKINDILLFTDSQIVLHWIQSPYKKLHTFVSHRLMEIIELTKSDMWNYVNTKQNPADLLTRGVYPQNLQSNTLWWNGPQWIYQDPSTWPMTSAPVISSEDLQIEVIQPRTSHAVTQQDTLTDFYTFFQRHSSLNKLTRVLAYMFRFINNTRSSTKDLSFLTTQELKSAHNFIIKIIQRKHFSKEYQELTSLKLQSIQSTHINNNTDSNGTSSENNNVQVHSLYTFKSSPLRKLNPFLDDDDIIRTGGRIQNSDIPYSQAHPIVLPSKEYVTTLIIRQFHLRLLHIGIQGTLFGLRLKYWPINGRMEVRKVIHKCVRCVRFNAQACGQQMASLPTPRVTLTRAFLHVGVDFSGAVYVRNSMLRNCKYTKGYICLFICLSSKAIHLELVSELSSQAFICALKRFISRRGYCSHLYSDNATNFKGANNELHELYQMFKNDSSYSQIIDYCNINAIDWKFTIPLASHMGGIYEAGIKSVKGLLKRYLGNVRLTYEFFYTVLVQIEGILNSRPLCSVFDIPDNDDVVCLTPAHFLIGSPISDLPEPSLVNRVENRLNMYQKITQIKQKFWVQFYNNYLSELQPRSKWLLRKPNIEIGQIVLLKDEATPPACWPLGKIISVNKNASDNLVRSVQIQTQKGVFVRPIHKVILLPVN